MLGFIPMFSFEYQISIHSAENPARQGSSETAPAMMNEIAFFDCRGFRAVELLCHARSTGDEMDTDRELPLGSFYDSCLNALGTRQDIPPDVYGSRDQLAH
jgi:hypothetical protein